MSLSRMTIAQALCIVVCVLAGCPSSESRARVEGRRVVAAFDAIMNAGEGRRGAPLESFRHLTIGDRATRRSRDSCLRMFDAVARASTIQRQLEPMATELERLADAGIPVPETRRVVATQLFREATRAADEAGAELNPCVHGIDALRVHAARTR